MSSCLVWWPGQNNRITSLSFFHGCRKRLLYYSELIALTPDIDCDQTVIGLPPVRSIRA
jgi:hypothetical protein